MKAINSNLSLAENSFIIQLYEYSLFDVKLLEELIFDIVRLVEKSGKELPDAEIINHMQGLYFIHYKCMKYIISHYDPKDLFRIKNLSEDYRIYLSRFTFSLEMLLKKDYKRLHEYYDDLGKLVTEKED